MFPRHAPPLAEQTETVRQLIYAFWHDWAHFITAMGRGQLWWGYGQLEILRRMCIDLARLHHNVLDGEVGAETYFKLETVMPVEQLAPLQATFCPQEPEAMLEAADAIIRFYEALAPVLAQAHGMAYPQSLVDIGRERLEHLRQGNKGIKRLH